MPHLNLAFLGLAVSFGLGFMTPAASAADMPPKMIFFVATTTCPAGSTVAQDAAGRVMVVTTSVANVGKTVGVPMKDQVDNTHSHSTTLTVSLPTKSIAGAASCCNSQATTKGDHTGTFTSADGTTGLPFIQLLVCEAN